MMHATDEIARMMAMDAAAHGGGTAPVDSYTKSETDALLEQKADKSEVTESVTAAVAQIVANAPEDFDTLKEMSDWIASHEDSAAAMNSAILKNAADIDAVETQQTEQAAAISAVTEEAALNRSTLGYQRKNLLKNTATSKTQNGLTFTVNDDFSVNVNGTATTTTFCIVNSNFVVDDMPMILTGCPAGGSTTKYQMDILNGSDESPIVVVDTGSGKIFDKSMVTAGEGIVRIRINKGSVLSNLTFYPMIRPAEITDDTYEPYKPSVQEQIEIVNEKKIDKAQIPDLMSLSMKMICPNNSVIPDDSGGVSAMVYIPAFKLKEVLTGYGNKGDELHPAFIVNGKQIPGFYYSKYQNHVNSGVAHSLPAEDPTANITFDTSRSRCTAKGAGWHLSTNAECAAIALWCKKNGFMPYGNNYYGRDTRESNYHAIPTTKGTDGRTNHVATGTGPLSWSHDQTPSGIWDLSGNVAEWQGGIRTVWGELQILENNDAADPDNPQNATSTCWKAINATTGALVEPECSTTDTTGTPSGNTVRLDWVSNAWVFKNAITNVQTEYKSCTFGKVTAGSTIGEAAKVLLRALALLPDEGTEEEDYEGDYAGWHNGAAERCVARGGNFASGEGAGVFCVGGGYARSGSIAYVGFRSAYIPEIG